MKFLTIAALVCSTSAITLNTRTPEMIEQELAQTEAEIMALDSNETYNPIAYLNDLQASLIKKQRDYANQVTDALNQQKETAIKKELKQREDEIKRLQAEMDEIRGKKAQASVSAKNEKAIESSKPAPAPAKPASTDTTTPANTTTPAKL